MSSSALPQGCAAASRSAPRRLLGPRHPLQSQTGSVAGFQYLGFILADLLATSIGGDALVSELLPWSIGVSDDTG